MEPHAIRAPRLFTGERFLDDHVVLIGPDGRVEAVGPPGILPEGRPCRFLPDGLLAPGFIDAQVNGGGGVLFNAVRTPAGVADIAVAHRRFGSTGLLPTFITDRPEARAEAVATARIAVREAPGVLGLHLEGPWLAPARKGAHDPALIVPMSDADVDGLLGAGLPVLLVTVAPEAATPGQIRRLTEGGVIVSLGHSDASLEVATAAVEAGARGVTHLFNAMSQLGHRAPGLVGATLDNGGVWAGLIADGHHVDPAALRVALRSKRPPGRLFLVSDAMPPAGSPGDTFTLGGRTVTRRDGRLTLEDGTLAGSDLTMDAALRFAVRHLEVGLGEALRMASLYPAEFLRLDKARGRLAPGHHADLVWLDDALAVRGTWIGGVA